MMEKFFRLFLLHIFPQMPYNVGVVISIYSLPFRNRFIMHNSMNKEKIKGKKSFPHLSRLVFPFLNLENHPKTCVFFLLFTVQMLLSAY
jgi:hypothetical protein